MKFQHRIGLTLSALALCTALATGGALLTFHSVIDSAEVLRNREIVAARNAIAVLGALERLDSATLEAILGAADTEELDTLSDSLEALLEERAAHDGAGLSGGPADDMASAIDRYHAARQNVLQRPAASLAAYESEVAPVFQAVRGIAVAEIHAASEAMESRTSEIERILLRAGYGLGGLLVLAMFITGTSVRQVRRAVAEPLAQLARASNERLVGAPHIPMQLTGDEELQALVQHVDALHDLLDSERARAQGITNVYRDLVLGVLAALPERGVVVDAAGTALASTLDERGTAAVLQAVAQAPLSTDGVVVVQTPHYRATPLCVGTGGSAPAPRQLGWFVCPIRAESSPTSNTGNDPPPTGAAAAN